VATVETQGLRPSLPPTKHLIRFSPLLLAVWNKSLANSRLGGVSEAREINELYIIYYVIYVLFSRIQYWSLDYASVFWTMLPIVIGYVASGFL